MDDFSKKLKDNLDSLLEHKGRIFGLIYPYIFTIMLALGLLYVTNLGEIARRQVPPAVPDTSAVSDLQVVEARTIPPVDIKTIGNQTQELVEKGKTLYANACASCHGENGTGDGAASIGLNPAPRNFKNPDQWKNGPKLSGIYKTLEEGIPGTAMISYEYMTPEEKISLAHYIRSSFIPNAPADTPEDLTNLDLTYNLSQGKEVSAQIPVSRAMDIFLDENKTQVSHLLDILNIMSGSRNEPGYIIFNDIAVNKVQAAAVLNASKEWKTDQENFIAVVLGNVNRLTFSRKANSLSSDDWDQLHNFMSRYF